MRCNLCGRACGTDRSVTAGACGAGANARAARAALHFWEEPCISGKHGSGAVFFTGCPLFCVYCQNAQISRAPCGNELGDAELAGIFLDLQEKGAHNINLVSPTQYAANIASALRIAGERLHIPVVYNTGGYDGQQALLEMQGLVSVYMPDIKYFDEARGRRYSGVPNYFKTASEAITQMYRQTGPICIEDGLLKRGLLIRHLVLPGGLADTQNVLSWLAANLAPSDIMLSLLNQYTPLGVSDYPEINRRLTTYEYEKAAEKAAALGFVNGYTQSRCSSGTDYVPEFDGSGLQQTERSEKKGCE